MPAHLDIAITGPASIPLSLSRPNTQEYHYQMLEIHRRQISCMMSVKENIKEEKRCIAKDEIFDAFYVL